MVAEKSLERSWSNNKKMSTLKITGRKKASYTGRLQSEGYTPRVLFPITEEEQKEADNQFEMRAAVQQYHRSSLMSMSSLR